MHLFIRFTRALLAFALILGDYVVQRALTQLVAPRRFDPALGHKRRRRPEWLKRRRDRVDERNAQRTLDAMLRLRGVYIKLGQVLSIMGGFLPRAYTKKLSVLQDKVPAHSFEEIEPVFKAQLGKPPSELFARIEREPVAAASLGQVHVAYLHDGAKVAVKILYPAIRNIIRIDMMIVRMAIRVYKWFVPVDSIENVYHSLVDLLRRETDYLHEAACMKRMAANFRGADDILFPSVVDELTTRDVLTMTYMEGVKITNFEALEALGIERRAVATKLVQSFYKQLFVDRFFHADPHPGNFLVQRGEDGTPRLVVLDFGAISEAKTELIDGLMDVVQGLFTNDVEKLIDGFLGMGFVAPNADRSALGELARTYFAKLMKFEDRSPGAFLKRDPRELAREFGKPDLELDDVRELMKSVHYPETWFYVERASVLLFWLSATIDPTLDTVQVGFPYVMPLLMQRNLRAAEERAKRAETRPSQPPAAAVAEVADLAKIVGAR
jgi:predicted unusual protein kinase regulating ubiquinone biosynthesis (AarF/ABC1/UbiB family)